MPYRLSIYFIAEGQVKPFHTLVDTVNRGIDAAMHSAMLHPDAVFAATVKDRNGEICAAIAPTAAL